MRLDHLPGCPHLAYCTNIHAGETWLEISASLDRYVPRIKELVCPDAPMGIGLRLSAVAAAALLQPSALCLLRDQLKRLGAYVFTINAFPYGLFHGTRVKERVYEPDWRSEKRTTFTADAAHVLAELLPEGGYGSVSTVPGGFRALQQVPGAVEAVSARLLSAAVGLVDLERRTGRTIALALEPEPWCLIETADEAVEFFERTLLARDAIRRFAALARIAASSAEAAVRRHIGVCYDVCHGAVQFEDPVHALRNLRRAGIEVPKLQLSAALRVPGERANKRRELERFDTGVYLHQVVARGRRTESFVDLPDAFEALAAGRADGEWRVHCHVPVFLRDLGGLATTQDALLATLRALRDAPLSPHLEVETYTWDVLPKRPGTASKADDIARELRFVLEGLTNDAGRGR